VQPSELTLTNDSNKVKYPTQVKSFIRKTSFFLLAFLLEWTWGTINRIQNLAQPKKPIFALFMLHAIFTPLQGFINSVVYFLIWEISKKKKKRVVVDGHGNRESSDLLE
jgi:Na+/melibiose symporter-like transporter